MNLFVVVDDRGGMTFGGRRLSQDRVLRRRMLEMVSEQSCHLWMNAYSRKLFSGLSSEEEALLITEEDFLSKTPAGDCCYVENNDVLPYVDRIGDLYVCLWNRRYPADTYWPLDMNEWTLLSTEEFKGSSHEKITINRWHRST